MSEYHEGQVSDLVSVDRALTSDELAHPELWDGLASVMDFRHDRYIELKDGQIVVDKVGGHHGTIHSPEGG